MSSRVAKKNAAIAGGEIAKQRPLRRRIRDTARLLSREEIPETVRLTKERVLKSLKQELTEKLEEKRNKKKSKMYRMVRFFEKRKVTRMLRTKIKLYKDYSPENRVEMEEEISRLRVELNYIEYYPEKLKYQALYPSTETTSAKAIARRERLLASTAERVASGELASTAERVASGELVDVSLGLCSVTPLEGRSLQHVTELAMVAKSVEEVLVEEDRKKKRDKPRKAAPVDEEPDSDWEIASSKNFSKDDFFLDRTGNS